MAILKISVCSWLPFFFGCWGGKAGGVKPEKTEDLVAKASWKKGQPVPFEAVADVFNRVEQTSKRWDNVTSYSLSMPGVAIAISAVFDNLREVPRAMRSFFFSLLFFLCSSLLLCPSFSLRSEVSSILGRLFCTCFLQR